MSRFLDMVESARDQILEQRQRLRDNPEATVVGGIDPRTFVVGDAADARFRRQLDARINVAQQRNSIQPLDVDRLRAQLVRDIMETEQELYPMHVVEPQSISSDSVYVTTTGTSSKDILERARQAARVVREIDDNDQEKSEAQKKTEEESRKRGFNPRRRIEI